MRWISVRVVLGEELRGWKLILLAKNGYRGHKAQVG